ncbi:GAP family protein [Mycobacterium decipiens]|uniref:Gap protein n=1 Tax=Mycobacterium decipiens TaxID=1430326 RepID=A0A1X2LRU9_9MYCO|nr:GAP family protein [Mycobacterium decipiens]OSC39381.1 hypothetical protein B8W66_17330 [Mycobacterium decipiens]
MWVAVLFFGIGNSLDPLRFGLTALLLSRPRPVANLLAFWLGGITAGIGVATAVLLLLREVALGLLEDAASAFESAQSSVAILAAGRLQITLGVLALLVAAVLRARHQARVAVHSGGAPALAPQPSRPNPLARLMSNLQDMLDRGLIWGAFAAGLGSATPPAECLIVLTAIMASGAPVGVQFSAFVAFTLLLLAVVEISLVAYLAVPRKAEAVVMQLDRWVRAHRPQITQTVLIVVGIAWVVQGIGRL